MVITDPIADLLTRIRNALMAKHLSLDVPFSNTKYEIIKILRHEGFIKAYKSFENNNIKTLRIYLKYAQQNNPVISGLKRISKPGRRVYVNKENVPKVLGGVGIAIISTSKGIKSDKETRNLNIGGEVLCYIW